MLKASCLRLNLTKTQIMWLGSGQQLAKVDADEVSLLASRVHILDAAWNLGVLFDSQLSMSAQVSAVCRTSYYQLRQLRPLVWCLSEDAVKTLIQAFINTRLEYCNWLYFSIADGLMSRLQLVQNATALLITRVRRCEHITPVLCQLHWLPVRRRVEFKISTLVYRLFAGTAAAYLAGFTRWRMYAGHRRWPPSFAVRWQPNMCHQAITQPVWWPFFCHRRLNAVEQSAWTAMATVHHL